MAENKGSHISWEWKIAIGWLTPHFKQNRCISIAIWNIKQSGLQYQLQKQSFLARTWLKSLKTAGNEGNTIFWEWTLAIGWLAPHFKQDCLISIVI